MTRRTVGEAIDDLFREHEAITSSQVAEVAHVTRQTAFNHLSRLVRDGVLVSEGARRSSRYRRATLRSARYAISGLNEDEVWGLERMALRSLAPDLVEPGPLLGVLSFAVTEMVNNAIDHSRGESLEVHWFLDHDSVSFEVVDDGIGAFASLRESRQLASNLQAVGELSKGKQTVDPQRHSGLGIFLTSRLVSRFTLSANGLEWMLDRARGDQMIAEQASTRRGTRVRCQVVLDTQMTLADIVGEVSDPVTHRLNRTSLRVDIFREGAFVSRTQAKLIGARLEGFEVVELDFTGVAGIGQGFADELFRVWQREHPGIRLEVLNANEAVRAMIAMVQAP